MAHDAQSDPSYSPPESAIPKAPSGIKGLDEVMHGGLPVGRTTLVSGGPGTGKTIVALESVYRAALAGEPGLFVSFEERPEAVRANARALGWDLEALERAGTLKVAYSELPLTAVTAGDFTIEGLLAILGVQADAIGAQRIVLDALDTLLRVFPSPDRVREEFIRLHDWLRNRAATAILTVKTNEQGRPIHRHLDFLVDCVLYLDQRIDGQVRTRRLRVVKYRGSGFLSNEYPYVISSNGVVLIPVSSASLMHRALGDRIPSGIDRLDALLGGGYRRGASILVAGVSGTGKTCMACTFVRAAAGRGERTLYVSFEESQEMLVDAMQSAGIDLNPALDAGLLRILTAMPESMGVEEHLVRVLDAIDAFQPRHIVVDAISACVRMGSQHAAFDFLVRVITACKGRGITGLMTNQVEEDSFASISGIGVSSLVDTAIAMQFVEAGDAIGRRFLIIKSRGTAHSHRYHRLAITDKGLVIDPHADPPQSPPGSPPAFNPSSPSPQEGRDD